MVHLKLTFVSSFDKKSKFGVVRGAFEIFVNLVILYSLECYGLRGIHYNVSVTKSLLFKLKEYSMKPL